MNANIPNTNSGVGSVATAAAAVSQILSQHTQQDQKAVKVFISYSVDDLKLVEELAKQIEPLAEVRYWNKSKEPGEEAWKQIFGWIDESDTILAVVTGKTVIRAMSVGQEIGHAKAKNKKIVPLVAEGIPVSDLGCLSGIVFEPIPTDNPAPALERIRNLFLPKKKPAHLDSTATPDASSGICEFVVLLGIIALVWLVFFNKKK